MKKLFLFFAFAFSLFTFCYAQPGRDETLASSYLQNGEFDKAMKELKPNEVSIRALANAFETYHLYDYVISVYDRGGKISHNESYFSFELAQAYLNKGDIANAVKFYLLNLETNPQNVQTVKNTVQTSRDELKLLD